MPTLTLDQVFSRTARDHPGRVAIQEGWHQLTYDRTELQAVRLASALVLGGVQLGDALIVHCANHRQALVAQLAVFKAGAVCVPPPDRPGGLATLARATGARAVLCSRATYDGTFRDIPSLALDDPATWRKIAAVPEEPALPRSSPEGVAHLLPDRDGGARLVDHRSWLRSAAGRGDRVGTPTGTVATSAGPLSRLGLAAMGWAVSSGATLHTASWNPDDEQWPLTASGDCVAVLTPEKYAALLERGPRPTRRGNGRGGAGGSGPRAVVLVGEPCSRELAARHFAVRPRSRLWAEFAPTDGALPWTAHEITARDARSSYEPGAGSPVPPVQLHIAGPGGETLPRGARGEIVAMSPPWFPEDVQHSGWHGCWTPDHTLDITARPPRPRADTRSRTHAQPYPAPPAAHPGRLEMEVI
ncbi:AMP-binding protein [Streptomyces profundus]|uniref:AMP-binding protein n=1 Tax=Streptomyces profundus TaxID=2867410 RepID=UPI001D16179C|nr:AMP-binding protein [Streptomyces sp. MA3_2.13]UED88044.1 long-chain fatty acid--CoA ligase [Streptomyces sp. MA3_2.13]